MAKKTLVYISKQQYTEREKKIKNISYFLSLSLSLSIIITGNQKCISVSLIYWYYPIKDHFFFALLVGYFQRERERVGGRQESKEKPWWLQIEKWLHIALILLLLTTTLRMLLLLLSTRANSNLYFTLFVNLYIHVYVYARAFKVGS